MTKDQKKMFSELATFLRVNASLVADARDSNAPWDLLDKLNRFEGIMRQRRSVRDGKKKARGVQ